MIISCHSIKHFPLEHTHFDYLFASPLSNTPSLFVHTVQIGFLLVRLRTDRARRLGLLPRARDARHDFRPQKQQAARGRRRRDAAAAAKVAGEPRPPQPCVFRVWERENPPGSLGRGGAMRAIYIFFFDSAFAEFWFFSGRSLQPLLLIIFRYQCFEAALCTFSSSFL
jgi:hypothetical protein